MEKISFYTILNVSGAIVFSGVTIMTYTDLKTITAFCNDWDSLFGIGAIHIEMPIDKNRTLRSVKRATAAGKDPVLLQNFINHYFPKGNEIYDVQSCADTLDPYQ